MINNYEAFKNKISYKNDSLIITAIFGGNYKNPLPNDVEDGRQSSFIVDCPRNVF